MGCIWPIFPNKNALYSPPSDKQLVKYLQRCKIMATVFTSQEENDTHQFVVQPSKLQHRAKLKHKGMQGKMTLHLLLVAHNIPKYTTNAMKLISILPSSFSRGC